MPQRAYLQGTEIAAETVRNTNKLKKNQPLKLQSKKENFSPKFSSLWHSKLRLVPHLKLQGKFPTSNPAKVSTLTRRLQLYLQRNERYKGRTQEMRWQRRILYFFSTIRFTPFLTYYNIICNKKQAPCQTEGLKL